MHIALGNKRDTQLGSITARSLLFSARRAFVSPCYEPTRHAGRDLWDTNGIISFEYCISWKELKNFEPLSDGSNVRVTIFYD